MGKDPGPAWWWTISITNPFTALISRHMTQRVGFPKFIYRNSLPYLLRCKRMTSDKSFKRKWGELSQYSEYITDSSSSLLFKRIKHRTCACPAQERLVVISQMNLLRRHNEAGKRMEETYTRNDSFTYDLLACPRLNRKENPPKRNFIFISFFPIFSVYVYLWRRHTSVFADDSVSPPSVPSADNFVLQLTLCALQRQNNKGLLLLSFYTYSLVLKKKIPA